MAGSISTTATDAGLGTTKYAIAWTSDASGGVSANTVAVKTGRLHQVKFIPAGGGNAPTDLYDVTLLDADGVDLLFGAGTDRFTATSNFAAPRIGSGVNTGLVFIEGGNVTPTITNAGNVKQGTLVLYIGP